MQDISEIEEGSEFMDIIDKNRVDIVIHGHRHHPIVKTIQTGTGRNPITLICAGSFSVNAQHRNNGEIPNTMHILEIGERDKGSVLYNYKYTASEGWKSLNYCKDTPLDYKMKLGKIYSDSEIKEEILKLPTQHDGCVTWEELNEKLQYVMYEELNAMIKRELSEKYRIVGNFPDEVCFLPKGATGVKR